MILRCNIQCKSHSICPFRGSIFVYNSGRGSITASNNTVHHRFGQKVARPIRGSLRSSLKDKFKNGATVSSVQREQNMKRSKMERKGNNYDITGTSTSTLRTIKQEALLYTSLTYSVETGLSNLMEHFKDIVNNQGIIKGAIHVISLHPRKVIVFTEASIRLYDKLMSYSDTIISWDATGGILKQSGGQRVLYYELTITLPGVTKENSLVPLTFMISDSHSELDVKHWLEHVKNAYRKVI